MEDIKSLDDFIKGNFQKDKLENYKGSYKMGFLYYKDLQLAIENLINRNKELEESISKEYKLGFAQAEYETNEDWKFKITEKIDELKDKLWRLQIQFNELKNYAKKEEFLSEQLKIWGAIQILEEILGGKQ